MTEAEGFTIRPATAADLAAINRIYNDEVLHGTATWDEQPWSAEQRRAWLEDRDASTPVLVAEAGGEVAGFGYLSQYRPKVGYRFTREDTVYVDPRFHRRGIGGELLVALIEAARRSDVHALIAVIEATNIASVALHERYRFELIGTEREVGFKFGRWLDSVYMELLLGDGED